MLSAVPKYKACLEEFKGEFTKPTYESLAQLATAVIACEGSKTVRNMHKTLDKDERKSRTAYEYFFHKAKWSDVEVANRKAEVFFRAAKLNRSKKLFLTIDDTLEEKKGEATEGVGSFFDHAKQRYMWGNNFVTSALQVGEVYIPHLARMYIKEEDAGENFRSKFDIAYEIISTLKAPESTSVYVLFDSWWYTKDFICKILALGYNVVGQLKVNSLVNGINVSELAQRLTSSDFGKVSIKVRGRAKSYYAYETTAAIEGIGEVKLVVSKNGTAEEPKFYFSTDVSLQAKEILEAYENRWNIETAHQLANQVLGFKDYQMRSKEAIERFMQLAFLVWAVLIIAKLRNTGDIEAIVREMRLSQLVDEARIILLAQLFIKLYALLERRNVPSMEEAVEALRQLIE